MPERRHHLLDRPLCPDSIARRPENFAGSPEAGMDAFSEILSGVKLRGAVFFSAEFSAPWGFSTPTTQQMAETHAAQGAHLVLYHLVVDGAAVVEMADGQAIALERGDVVIFPHGHAHDMRSGKD